MSKPSNRKRMPGMQVSSTRIGGLIWISPSILSGCPYENQNFRYKAGYLDVQASWKISTPNPNTPSDMATDKQLLIQEAARDPVICQLLDLVPGAADEVGLLSFVPASFAGSKCATHREAWFA